MIADTRRTVKSHTGVITIHIDGLNEPTNPNGFCCWAYVCTDDTGNEVGLNYGCIGVPGDQKTNNEAEYQALIEALKRADQEGWYCCRILSDSKLVVQQTLGQWNCNQPHLQVLRNQAQGLLAKAHAVLEWIPREENERADHLSRVAYDKARKAGRS
jgi:ribonuclease HI